MHNISSSLLTGHAGRHRQVHTHTQEILLASSVQYSISLLPLISEQLMVIYVCPSTQSRPPFPPPSHGLYSLHPVTASIPSTQSRPLFPPPSHGLYSLHPVTASIPSTQSRPPFPPPSHGLHSLHPVTAIVLPLTVLIFIHNKRLQQLLRLLLELTGVWFTQLNCQNAIL